MELVMQVCRAAQPAASLGSILLLTMQCTTTYRQSRRHLDSAAVDVMLLMFVKEWLCITAGRLPSVPRVSYSTLTLYVLCSHRGEPLPSANRSFHQYHLLASICLIQSISLACRAMTAVPPSSLASRPPRPMTAQPGTSSRRLRAVSSRRSRQAGRREPRSHPHGTAAPGWEQATASHRPSAGRAAQMTVMAACLMAAATAELTCTAAARQTAPQLPQAGLLSSSASWAWCRSTRAWRGACRPSALH
jgi:hypothetical protein